MLERMLANKGVVRGTDSHVDLGCVVSMHLGFGEWETASLCVRMSFAGDVTIAGTSSGTHGVKTGAVMETLFGPLKSL